MEADLPRLHPGKMPQHWPSDVVARYSRLVPMVVVAAFVGLLVVVTMAERPELSRIDEIAHIDHLVRGSRGELVRQDDHLSQEAMRAAACRGSDGEPYPPSSSESSARRRSPGMATARSAARARSSNAGSSVGTGSQISRAHPRQRLPPSRRRAPLRNSIGGADRRYPGDTGSGRGGRERP